MSLFVNCFFVAIGGIIGSVSRYLISLIKIKSYTEFPFVTFAINIIGAFIIGILAGILKKNSTISSHSMLLLKAGFCGSFTTFSTFSFESLSLFQNGHFLTGGIYIFLSAFFGIIAVLCGELIVNIY